jgi:pilus assembly protein CpaF
MLAAVNTVHDGGAGSIHASGAERVPQRLEALALAAGLGRSAAHAQIAAGIDAVVHLSRVRGVRRIEGIAALRRTSEGLTRAEPALLFEAAGVRQVSDGDLVQRIGDARC